ncbi:MAG: type I-B CRISPR-associated protein Cas8b1/Cst1, partial [Dictyoglomaceae bacterium]
RSKAEFLKDQSGRNFKDISNRFYVIKDKYRDITLELLEKILTNNLSYDYLSFLDYLFVENLKGTNNSVKIYYNPFNLHTLNLIISDYFQKFKKTGGEIMTTSRSEEQLWFMFKKGEELAEKLINEEHENKIPSITYKLLSHLRTENVDGFMNLVFRLYLSYGLEIPSLFVKAISEKDVFLSYGYSFVNGILTRYTSKKKIIDEEVKR